MAALEEANATGVGSGELRGCHAGPLHAWSWQLRGAGGALHHRQRGEREVGEGGSARDLFVNYKISRDLTV